MGQEPVLFSGTILDNIAYGIDRHVDGDVDPAMVRQRVEAAARQVRTVVRVGRGWLLRMNRSTGGSD